MLEENLNSFFVDFADDAVLWKFSPPLGKQLIAVIFDEEFVEMALGAEGRRITATCIGDMVETIRHKDVLQVKGKTYEVEGTHPIDDGAITQLNLRELKGSPSYESSSGVRLGGWSAFKLLDISSGGVLVG